MGSYLAFLAGPNALLGSELSQAGLTEMFRALFRHRNVRRAPGPQGELKKVMVARGDGQGKGVVEYLREDWGALGPWPVTMKVVWDED